MSDELGKHELVGTFQKLLTQATQSKQDRALFKRSSYQKEGNTQGE